MVMLEEWILPAPVSPEIVARVEAVPENAVPARFERTVTWHEHRTEAGAAIEWVAVVVRVGEDDVRGLALDLDRPLGHFLGWDWEDEIDQLDDEAEAYELVVELMNKVPETFDSGRGEAELPILSVYAKEGDNHAAWPAAFVLTARLARELGAAEPESLSSPHNLN